MHAPDDVLTRLRAIGWPDDDAARQALAAAGGECLARVVAQHRSGYDVLPGPGEPVRRVQPPPAWTRPRFPPEQRAAVGDWVTLDGGGRDIVALLPRRSVLKRAAAGEHYRQQLIAANVDHVLVVVGLDQDFNPRRIERYLVVVRASGAAPVLVLTKADQCPVLDDCLALLEEVQAGGVPIHAVNAKDAESLRVLHPYLGPGRTVVLVGSSGAGKSTLTNTLLGVEKMKTGTVREHDSRGRHTTTFRLLTPLPQGGCIIDTPGMRELKLSGDEDVTDSFEDIEAIAAGCRFRDCSHGNEPGCAVQEAIAGGRLDAERFASYAKLRDERDAAATSLAQRRAEERVLSRALNKRLKDKYGRR
ncbi:ribosome small subunit-dependent GTPase A [Arenimonas fontis]|uniref:Small ribosomal subunit biogenesis GTPase RsgA n=1 Tax=Arenimonas fontis TaxID=2608255 RepID=A0A5B2ZD21_9GAMM|nr:ribosome small subunit-dependent GTPase A [Arenimonas fontis]KAA2285100.1 ribosome small subunit-dependent GTPase A [Arenimonas fontis]